MPLCKMVRTSEGWVCKHCNTTMQASGRVPMCASSAQVRPAQNCINRGELLRVEKCKPCQSGGKTPEVYACAVHGECTLFSISKRKPDGSRWQSCLSCDERKGE